MSKSNLRKEYEARFGVVKGGFSLYNAKGNEIYYETSRYGVHLDNRPCSGRVFTEQQTGRKFKMVDSKMVEIK